MTHNHIEQGDYGKKHRPDARADSKVLAAVEQKSEGTHLSCAAAERIARDCGVSMEVVGKNADLAEIKIDKCQLGLFGYVRTHGKKRILETPKQLEPKLEEAIRDGVFEGKLACSVAWEISGRLKISRLSVCGAADALGIKTSSCQLGTF